MMNVNVAVILPIGRDAFMDIAVRIRDLGPQYRDDYFDFKTPHGLLLRFGETVLSIEGFADLDPGERVELAQKMFRGD